MVRSSYSLSFSPNRTTQTTQTTKKKTKAQILFVLSLFFPPVKLERNLNRAADLPNHPRLIGAPSALVAATLGPRPRTSACTCVHTSAWNGPLCLRATRNLPLRLHSDLFGADSRTVWFVGPPGGGGGSGGAGEASRRRHETAATGTPPLLSCKNP